jgi:hypothetical protein
MHQVGSVISGIQRFGVDLVSLALWTRDESWHAGATSSSRSPTPRGLRRSCTRSIDAHAYSGKTEPGPWLELEDAATANEALTASSRANYCTRLDPLDPSASRHLLQCEQAATTDPAFLRAVLKLTDRDDYWRVDCNACDGVWQVPHYAAESGKSA